jgi:hypothetical protein
MSWDRGLDVPPPMGGALQRVDAAAPPPAASAVGVGEVRTALAGLNAAREKVAALRVRAARVGILSEPDPSAGER